MISTFDRGGVSFRYPANWNLEIDADSPGDGGWSVTLHSGETAFLIVSLRPDAEDAVQVAEEALAALKAEYTELDAESAVETLAGQLAVGHDIDFLTVDTSVSCKTRCLDAAGGPLLVMYQTSQYDRDRSEPVLAAVLASMTVAAD